MKKKKMLLNIGTSEEKTILFDNFTKKRLDEMMSAKNYIIFYYDEFFKNYIPYDYTKEKVVIEYYNKNYKKYI